MALRRIPGFPFLIAILGLALPGCGSGPTLGEVDGTVTLNGKPLQGVEVVFSPDVGKGEDGRSSKGITDEQGRYVLTFADSKQPRPGAIVGKHKVVLVDVRWENLRGDPKRGLNRIPDDYGTFAATRLEFDVKPGQQTIPIEIKP